MNLKQTITFFTFITVAAVGMANTNTTGYVRMLQKTGGRVEQPLPEGAKKVFLIDATKAKDGSLLSFQKALVESLHIPTIITDKADGAAVCLTLVDGGEMVVYPVRGAATVPVAASQEETTKALWKALLCVLSSDTQVFTQEGLAITGKSLEARGIPTIRRTTYKTAVAEGWAPAPTNEFQKAIWDAAKK